MSKEDRPWFRKTLRVGKFLLKTISMKKVYMMLAVCAIALASCKKDYTCDCSYTSVDFPELNTSISYTFEAKKSDAESVCDGYIATAGGTGWDCKLK
jgi:hypothetical protein